MFSFEESIRWNGQTSVSSTLGRMQGRTQRASNDRLGCEGCEFQKVLSGSKCTYSLNDPGNSLNSQQMRPPSESARDECER
jgi:hypothetical protein